MPPRLAPCVCASLRQAARSVTQYYDIRLRPAGIRATQFHVLSTMRVMGEASVGQLEARLIMDQTTLTRSLRLLEKEGFVRRVLPQSDQRLKVVTLTAGGRQKLEKAARLWSEINHEITGKIGAARWVRLQADLSLIVQVTQERKIK